MKDFAITATRDLARAARRLQDLERYADRRDQLIDSLDLDALKPNQLSSIFVADDRINDDLAEGYLYICWLAHMQDVRSSLSSSLRNVT